MTDFDFEILEAISLYGEEGVEIKDLERNHFAGYAIYYNVQELSKIDFKIENLFGGSLEHGTENSACLKCRVSLCKNASLIGEVRYEYYSLTHKGRALLQNWQRRRAEKINANRRLERQNFLLNCLVGIGTGVIATIICTKILGL